MSCLIESVEGSECVWKDLWCSSGEFCSQALLDCWLYIAWRLEEVVEILKDE